MITLLLLVIVMSAVTFFVMIYLAARSNKRRKLWIKNLGPGDRVKLLPEKEVREVYKNPLDGHMWLLVRHDNGFTLFERVDNIRIRPFKFKV